MNSEQKKKKEKLWGLLGIFVMGNALYNFTVELWKWPLAKYFSPISQALAGTLSQTANEDGYMGFLSI